MNMGNMRLIWADSLKGWLMILVIIGHAIQTVLGTGCDTDHTWNLIYSFHMPAFMAVSGWLAYRSGSPKLTAWGGVSVCKLRFCQLLIPYFVWSLLQWALRGCSMDGLSKIILYPDSYFWFLWVLFWICCIFTFCKWLSDKLEIEELVPISMACVALMGIMVALDVRMFGFPFLAYYFLFYTLGYCIHRFPILQVKKNVMLATLGMVWLFMAWFWNMHELPSWMPAIPHVPSTLLQYAYRGFTAAIAIFVLLGVAPKTLNGKSLLNKSFAHLGVVSLGLYVVHLSFIGWIKDSIQALIPAISDSLAIVLLFVASFASSYIIVKLLTMNKWASRIMLGKI